MLLTASSQRARPPIRTSSSRTASLAISPEPDRLQTTFATLLRAANTRRWMFEDGDAFLLLQYFAKDPGARVAVAIALACSLYAERPAFAQRAFELTESGALRRLPRERSPPLRPREPSSAKGGGSSGSW